jgi:hypothetical protein
VLINASSAEPFPQAAPLTAVGCPTVTFRFFLHKKPVKARKGYKASGGESIGKISISRDLFGAPQKLGFGLDTT